MNYKDIMTDPNAIYDGILKSTANSNWKPSSQRARNNILSLAFDISDSLDNQTYTSKPESQFLLSERGRIRRVDGFNIVDRSVRHVLCDDILAPLIQQKIIYDNGASVKGRGISHARKRFEVHLRKYYMHHGSNEGWILFGDFSKFYDNILHEVAKKQLLDLVDQDTYLSWIFDIIFDSFKVDVSDLTDEEYNDIYNGVFDKILYEEEHKSRSKKRMMPKSISIGDQLSQQIGIYYPHRIDDYVKIVRGQKYYGRYMDDWYIISDSRKELLDLLHNIVEIGKPLGLHINCKKTYITKLSSTYKYLQVKYSMTNTGKIIKRINPKRVTTMRKRLRKLKAKIDSGEIEYMNVENMFRSWMGGFHKLMSKDQREGLLKLYSSLFNKHIEIIDNKMVITEEGSE
jgi:hypothetical protein